MRKGVIIVVVAQKKRNTPLAFGVREGVMVMVVVIIAVDVVVVINNII